MSVVEGLSVENAEANLDVRKIRAVDSEEAFETSWDLVAHPVTQVIGEQALVDILDLQIHCFRSHFNSLKGFFFCAPRGSLTPQPRGLRAIIRYSSPVQHLLHLEQGHQATFMLSPANHAAVLGEQLLAGSTDRLFFPCGVPQRLDARDLGRSTRYYSLVNIYHTWDGGTNHRASLVSLPKQVGVAAWLECWLSHLGVAGSSPGCDNL